MTSAPDAPVWRSLLYVPANVAKFVDRAHERGADAVILDLEDSVQPADKDAARAGLGAAMAKVSRAGADTIVRINRPIGMAVRDIEEAVRPGLKGLFITKTEGADHLRILDEHVSELEQRRGMPVGHVRFVGMIEHPRVVERVHETARATPRLAALTLGGEDFALEMGMVPAEEALELPKRLVSFAAIGAGLQMFGILGTVADYANKEANHRSAERARRFGFTGATCVHPGLVDILNAAFTPGAEEVAYAHKLIAADQTAAAEGRGSFTVDGKMIDIPVIDRARRLIVRHEAVQRRLAGRA